MLREQSPGMGFCCLADGDCVAPLSLAPRAMHSGQVFLLLTLATPCPPTAKGAKAVKLCSPRALPATSPSDASGLQETSAPTPKRHRHGTHLPFDPRERPRGRRPVQTKTPTEGNYAHPQGASPLLTAVDGPRVAMRSLC